MQSSSFLARSRRVVRGPPGAARRRERGRVGSIWRTPLTVKTDGGATGAPEAGRRRWNDGPVVLLRQRERRLNCSEKTGGSRTGFRSTGAEIPAFRYRPVRARKRGVRQQWIPIATITSSSARAPAARCWPPASAKTRTARCCCWRRDRTSPTATSCPKRSSTPMAATGTSGPEPSATRPGSAGTSAPAAPTSPPKFSFRGAKSSGGPPRSTPRYSCAGFPRTSTPGPPRATISGASSACFPTSAGSRPTSTTAMPPTTAATAPFAPAVSNPRSGSPSKAPSTTPRAPPAIPTAPTTTIPPPPASAIWPSTIPTAFAGAPPSATWSRRGVGPT